MTHTSQAVQVVAPFKIQVTSILEILHKFSKPVAILLFVVCAVLLGLSGEDKGSFIAMLWVPTLMSFICFLTIFAIELIILHRVMKVDNNENMALAVIASTVLSLYLTVIISFYKEASLLNVILLRLAANSHPLMLTGSLSGFAGLIVFGISLFAKNVYTKPLFRK